MCKCDKDNPDKSCDKCRGGRPTKYTDLDPYQVKKISELRLAEPQAYSSFMDLFQKK